MSIVNQGTVRKIKTNNLLPIKETNNMEKEAGLTYNEYRISKANQPQDGFVKKGFFKIKYFTKRFKAIIVAVIQKKCRVGKTFASLLPINSVAQASVPVPGEKGWERRIPFD